MECWIYWAVRVAILYVGNVGVIAHDGDDHRVPGFFYNRPAAFISVFHASPPCGTTLDLFHADDLATQTNTPALDKRQCECLRRRSSLRNSNAGNGPAAGTGRGCSEKERNSGSTLPMSPGREESTVAGNDLL